MKLDLSFKEKAIEESYLVSVASYRTKCLIFFLIASLIINISYWVINPLNNGNKKSHGLYVLLINTPIRIFLVIYLIKTPKFQYPSFGILLLQAISVIFYVETTRTNKLLYQWANYLVTGIFFWKWPFWFMWLFVALGRRMFTAPWSFEYLHGFPSCKLWGKSGNKLLANTIKRY